MHVLAGVVAVKLHGKCVDLFPLPQRLCLSTNLPAACTFAQTELRPFPKEVHVTACAAAGLAVQSSASAVFIFCEV